MRKNGQEPRGNLTIFLCTLFNRILFYIVSHYNGEYIINKIYILVFIFLAEKYMYTLFIVYGYDIIKCKLE